VREIRLLRAMWRALETESRNLLTGHEGGNAGYSQGSSYGFTRQRSTLPIVIAKYWWRVHQYHAIRRFLLRWLHFLKGGAHFTLRQTETNARRLSAALW
jgi:hypothetical protein